MHHFARRTAGIIAALALVSVIAAGCDKDDKDAKSDGSATTTQMAEATDHQGDHGAPTPETKVQETKIVTPNGDVVVEGSILEKYNAFGGVASPLGMPTGAQESAPDGGHVQEFAGGAIYSNPATGAHVVWGKIRDAWLAEGGPSGKLGYPTTDETDIPGGKQSEFSSGTITWVNDQITVIDK